ncbi:hypothetical protein PpBr36_06998 [Pyricularia pennisetigena]|nr:hypothetical protein PpBr36_06998 [Pyricularia pennisetigena]TLS25779.1 hypothetical protein PpBr36_06998 [Pyricularia pennisetigena]
MSEKKMSTRDARELEIARAATRLVRTRGDDVKHATVSST